jgi:hypothetical protein
MSARPSVRPLLEDQCSTSIFLRVLKCDWVGTKDFGSHKTSSLKPLLIALKKKISSTKWWVFIGVLQVITQRVFRKVAHVRVLLSVHLCTIHRV